MPLYLDPITYPNAWNVIVFGKLSTPVDAKVKVSGFARKNDYDVKVGKGTAGATITLKGQPPAEGTIEAWAWTPAHFAAWNAIDALLAYKPGKGASQTTATPTTGSSAASQGAGFTGGQTSTSAETSSGGGSAIPAPGNTSGKAKDTSDNSAADKSPPALSKNDAIAVYYPSLAAINMTAIVPPDELGAWEEDGDGTGLFKRTIKVKEFVQAGNNSISTTPTGASDGQPPGYTQAGSSEGAAPPNAANQAKGAGNDAQGAWGAA
jgi:hypothetical protein